MINAPKAIDSFLGFSREARPTLQVKNDQDYREAVAFLELLLERVEDRDDDPLLPLVDLIGQRIHAFENIP
jgi:hypothetical protein